MTTRHLHEALMKEFRAYFEENQKYETYEHHASGIRLRKHLYEIRRIALEMREEILSTRKIKQKEYAQKNKATKAQDNT
jgi:hypothetical protein